MLSRTAPDGRFRRFEPKYQLKLEKALQHVIQQSNAIKKKDTPIYMQIAGAALDITEVLAGVRDRIADYFEDSITAELPASYQKEVTDLGQQLKNDIALANIKKQETVVKEMKCDECNGTGREVSQVAGIPCEICDGKGTFEVVYCHGCSNAGGSGRAVFHGPPACPHAEKKKLAVKRKK